MIHSEIFTILLSGGTTSRKGMGAGIPPPIPPRRLCMLIKGAA